MKQVSRIGLDLAKNVFQVHGIDEAGEVVVRRQLRRSQVIPFFNKLPPCLVGIEACATSHHWARELQSLGHEVRIMPAHYVKAYVKQNKNDAADAAAICEAVTRPGDGGAPNARSPDSRYQPGAFFDRVSGGDKGLFEKRAIRNHGHRREPNYLASPAALGRVAGRNKELGRPANR